MMAVLTTIFRSENNQQANYNKPGQGLWLARVFLSGCVACWLGQPTRVSIAG
jgi:hypothetical protein